MPVLPAATLVSTVKVREPPTRVVEPLKIRSRSVLAAEE